MQFSMCDQNFQPRRERVAGYKRPEFVVAPSEPPGPFTEVWANPTKPAEKGRGVRRES